MDEFNISKYAPELAKNNPKKVKEVAKYLKDFGVPEECSLKDVTVEDLMENGMLKKGVARKLVEAWQKEGSDDDAATSNRHGIKIKAERVGQVKLANRDYRETHYGEEKYDFRNIEGDLLEGGEQYKVNSTIRDINSENVHMGIGSINQNGNKRKSADETKQEAKRRKQELKQAAKQLKRKYKS